MNLKVLRIFSKQNKVNPYVTRYFNDLPKGKVLDIGCGKGLEAACLAKKGFSVVGIDLDKNAINHAKKLKSNAEFRCSDFFRFVKDVQKNDYDYVIDLGFSHYLKRHEINRHYKEISRILKHNGKLFTFVFSNQDEYGKEHCPSRKWTFLDGLYVRFFDKQELHDLLRRHGFEIQSHEQANIKDQKQTRIYHIINSIQTIKKW